MAADRHHPAVSVRPGIASHACLAGLGVLLLLPAACRREAGTPVASGGEAPAQAGVLAQGDGWTIRDEDFRHWWSTRPGAADTPQSRSEVLETLVERASLAQAARQAGLESDPETAARMETVLITRLQEVQLAPQLEAVQVPDAEVRARYEALRDTTYTQPEAVRVAVLWFNTRGQQPLVDRYRPRLEQIRADVSADAAKFPVDAGFGPIAVGNTEHRPSRLLGGDLGWLDLAPGADSWRKAVLDLAAPLQNPGDLSDILAGQDGLFLVRLIERRAAAVRPFEAVRTEIHESLVEQRRGQLREEFTRRILSRSQAQRFPDALAALEELPSRSGARDVASLPPTPAVFPMPAPEAEAPVLSLPALSKPNEP